MEQHVAAEHLQVIRTLMERSALYRRTLAPIMLFVGSVGAVAALGGMAFHIEELPLFSAWWLGAAALAVAGAFVIARRQAVADGEPFWSPPALRVTQALMPPLAAGLVSSLALILFAPGHCRWLFVLANSLFYGCAVHAAGFFMPRGMKLLGWLIILFSCGTLLLRPLVGSNAPAIVEHVIMGALFGAGHLAYGGYLYVTERRKTAA